MKVEEIKLTELSEDPSNARQHPEKNLDAIISSLRKFSQQKPIVIGKDNVVIAGNGTLAAAKKLGWETIKCVRSDLTGAQAIAYGIADNRSNDLSDFDPAILGQHLEALAAENFNLDELGFSDDDLEKLLPKFIPHLPEDDDENSTHENKFLVIAMFENEDEQQLLFSELRDRGIKVKV